MSTIRKVSRGSKCHNWNLYAVNKTLCRSNSNSSALSQKNTWEKFNTHPKKFIEFDFSVLVFISLFDDIAYLIAWYIFSKSFHRVSDFACRDETITVQVKLYDRIKSKTKLIFWLGLGVSKLFISMVILT